MKVDLSLLRTLAEKATPGPWSSDDDGDVWTLHSKYQKWSDDSYFFHGSIGTTARGPDNGDAAYIAAANPQVVLELIERIESAREIIEYCSKKSGCFECGPNDMQDNSRKWLEES